MLLRIAGSVDESASAESILQGISLGKRHGRIFPSLVDAVQSGLDRDPHTLPHRPPRDPNHVSLNQSEIARLDRIRGDRDKVAVRLGIDPTLIANRSQLAQIARAPKHLSHLLLPWQAELLKDQPSLNEG
jgi:ribonuclease D